MSSGGGKTQTQTQTNDPPAWAVPHFQWGLQQARDMVEQPYTPYGGQMVAGMTPDQMAAQQMTRQQAGDKSMLNVGQGFTTGILGGQGQFDVQRNQFAGENPYLDQMIGNAQQDVVDAWSRNELPGISSQFNAGGAYGGSAHQQALSSSQQNLADQLGRISTNLRGQDYTNQQQLDESYLARQQQAWDSGQGRQMQALGMVPGLDQAGYYGAQQLGQQGLQQQLTDQAVLDANYGQFAESRDWQANRLGLLGNMLGTIQGGTSSVTSPNPNYRSAGQNALTAAAIAASFFSDENAKTDKTPMDPEKGLQAIRRMPFESWRYHGDTEQHAGTYSQDFYNALGMEPKPQINSIDMFGALGGAVKALDKKVSGRARA